MAWRGAFEETAAATYQPETASANRLAWDGAVEDCIFAYAGIKRTSAHDGSLVSPADADIDKGFHVDVDGGPSLVFLSLTLYGERVVEIERDDGCRASFHTCAPAIGTSRVRPLLFLALRVGRPWRGARVRHSPPALRRPCQAPQRRRALAEEPREALTRPTVRDARRLRAPGPAGSRGSSRRRPSSCERSAAKRLEPSAAEILASSL